jgi:hypothetical protein
MAYLRREKENVEVDYPISKVWMDLSKAIASLEWVVIEKNELNHLLKVKTKSNFMAYASEFIIQATPLDESSTKVAISAETPVTTITGIFDIGRTSERIETFLLALRKQVKGEDTDSEKKETE